MSVGSLPRRAFRRRHDNTVRVRFCQEGPPHHPRHAFIVPCVVNSELVKKNASEKILVSIHKQQTAAPAPTSANDGRHEVVMERNDEWSAGDAEDQRVSGAWCRGGTAARSRAGRCRHSYNSVQVISRDEGERSSTCVAAFTTASSISHDGPTAFDNPKCASDRYAITVRRSRCVLFRPWPTMSVRRHPDDRTLSGPPTNFQHDMERQGAAGSPVRQRLETTISFRPEFCQRQEPLCICQ